MKSKQHLAEYDVLEAPVLDRVSGFTPQPLALGLPRGVAGGFVALLGLYLVLMAVGFGSGTGMGIVLVICGICLAGYAGVPVMCGRVSPPAAEAARDGVETMSGHASKGEAAVLVLMLPALMLVWAAVILVIRASVL